MADRSGFFDVFNNDCAILFFILVFLLLFVNGKPFSYGYGVGT